MQAAEVEINWLLQCQGKEAWEESCKAAIACCVYLMLRQPLGV